MEESINFNNVNFHLVLKDVENLMLVFILQNYALANPDVQNAIQTQGEPMSSLLDRYNKLMGLNIKLDAVNNTYSTNTKIPISSLAVMGKTIAILTYDLLLASAYSSAISKMEEMQFLKYVRNGAAHYNKFNIKDEEGEWKLGKEEIIKWDGKEISRRLHGIMVFNDFTNMFEMFLLANYFSEKLKEINRRG